MLLKNKNIQRVYQKKKHRKVFMLIVFLFYASGVFSQSFGVKTNFLYGASTTPNLGLELGLGTKWTLEASGGYNPWEFGNNRQIKHWAAQIELRNWLCYTFEGHFFGLHFQGGEFNLSGVWLPSYVFGSNARDYRFQGYFMGGGISYGYQWILGNYWSLEANIGVGYNYVTYDKFYSEECGCFIEQSTPSPGYFGPTKLGLSLIYLIK